MGAGRDRVGSILGRAWLLSGGVTNAQPPKEDAGEAHEVYARAGRVASTVDLDTSDFRVSCAALVTARPLWPLGIQDRDTL